ncbi:hypothetical protein [Pseudomonas gessardii]|uniref:hypothetical protein n=1 Tax=Pseudomonas gessardii TaxID=78544 RepID=UPI0018D9DB2F|nr:hypothetical protein [Pseudomonas gessardii]MBH3426025.1 hypothetical protein [Pseudomonas gessardii]
MSNFEYYHHYLNIDDALMTPISSQQLQFHLDRPSRRVRLVEQDDGFVLHVRHTETTHVLHAQRNHVRVFKCITRAAELLRRYGVAKFTVVLQGQPLEEDDEDLIGSSQSLPTNTEDGQRRRIRRPVTSFNFDDE